MKKVAATLPFLLWGLMLLYPVGKVVAAYYGYLFQMVFPATGAVLGIAAVVLDAVFHPTIHRNFLRWLPATLPLLSMINALFYLCTYPTPWMIACVAVSVGCCCYLSLRLGKPFVLTVVSLALSAAMILPTVFMFQFASVFPIGINTVVKNVDSPDGTYVAQVVDSDQGALGGDTIVQVKETKTVNCLLFTLEKKPQRVYMGDWGVFETMQIYWRNEECLVINGREYTIE